MSTRFSRPISRPGVAIRKRDFGLVKDWKQEIGGGYQTIALALFTSRAGLTPRSRAMARRMRGRIGPVCKARVAGRRPTR